MTTTSYVAFTTIRDAVPALTGAAAFSRSESSVVINGEQLQVRSMIVSGGYFDLLGVTPLLGPGIHADGDAVITAAPPAVISHAFWQSRLLGDLNVLDRRVSVGGLEYSIAGVMPRGFSGHSAVATDIWVTFDGAMRNEPGWDHDDRRNLTSVVVRLGANESAVAAASQAGVALGRDIVLRSITGTDIASTDRRIAWWLAAVSMAVFAIALANAATLLVVRGARLRHDIAIRAALGASRSRLMREGALAAVLLAVCATAASLALASWLDDAVRRVLFPGVIARVTTSASVLWAAAVCGVIAALVGAMANTRQVARAIDSPRLAGAEPGSGRRSPTMTWLLLVQMTLSVMLLAGAGMFGGSLYRLLAQDFGMEMSDVLLVNTQPGPGVMVDEQLYRDALAKIRTLPDVESATTINSIPFTGFNVPPIAVPGFAEPPSVGGQLPFLVAATPEFFAILGIRVIEGRGLTEADDSGAPVVLVNQTMAKTLWPSETAIGKCIRVGFPQGFQPESGPPVPDHTVACREVVGVVNDTRQRSLFPQDNEDRLMQYYVPFSQVPFPPFLEQEPTRVHGLLVRPRQPSDQLITTIRSLVVSDRADLPFIEIRPYAQVLDRQLRPWRVGTTLLTLFSVLALLVASVGLYATFAYLVTERRREIAIRLAVGARPSGVLAMVMREAVGLAAVGAAAGCLAAIGFGRMVTSLLYDTTPSDPLVLGAAAVAMVVVAAAATLLPARTASKSEPSVLLRTT